MIFSSDFRTFFERTCVVKYKTIRVHAPPVRTSIHVFVRGGNKRKRKGENNIRRKKKLPQQIDKLYFIYERERERE